ncbi:hypothetical protein [Streptomyces meridianus]|uniref:Uncharacterized protein n=1 Tax=Streptomyces meridianus TaxID=2938945 RepID=A0ABT0X851_9ACTN|nr:hypothetical protein [Streptomyces meridianus]MCM2578711.1 hypothetical protein [Streptomyces meridianus]
MSPEATHQGGETAWFRCYWAEEDVWFFFAVDARGDVIRQIELQGPEQRAIAAASLPEWQKAFDAGGVGDYENRFGATAQAPVSEWEGHQPELLDAKSFEDVWEAARRELTAR